MKITIKRVLIILAAAMLHGSIDCAMSSMKQLGRTGMPRQANMQVTGGVLPEYFGGTNSLPNIPQLQNFSSSTNLQAPNYPIVCLRLYYNDLVCLHDHECEDMEEVF